MLESIPLQLIQLQASECTVRGRLVGWERKAHEGFMYRAHITLILQIPHLTYTRSEGAFAASWGQASRFTVHLICSEGVLSSSDTRRYDCGPAT